MKMGHVLIIHHVRDYPVWKEIFDRAEDLRKEAGEISFRLLRDERESNRIVHFSEWKSLDGARAFFESPQLVRIREEAGVEAPEFHYLEELESGIL